MQQPKARMTGHQRNLEPLVGREKENPIIQHRLVKLDIDFDLSHI